MNDDNECTRVDFDSTQKDIIQRILKNIDQNFLITGGAGTGKSEIIRALAHEFKKKKIGFKILSSYGIAAQNVDGATIHSFFYIPVKNLEIAHLKKLPKCDNLIPKILILDEISTLSSKILYAMEARMFQWTNKSKFKDVQIIAVGDFCQLWPIINADEKNFKDR